MLGARSTVQGQDKPHDQNIGNQKTEGDGNTVYIEQYDFLL